MITLHITFLDAIPYLWADEEFIKDLEELRKAIHLLNLPYTVLREEVEKIVVWLPSRKDKTRLSSSKIGEKVGHNAIALIPRFVLAKPLTPYEYVSTVTTLTRDELKKRNIQLSTSLKWTISVVRVLLSLQSQDEFLPLILEDNTEPIRGVLGFCPVEYHEMIQKMILLTPAVCRCGTKLKSMKPYMTRESIFDTVFHLCLRYLHYRLVDLQGQVGQDVGDHWMRFLTGDKLDPYPSQSDGVSRELHEDVFPLEENENYQYGFCLTEPQEGGIWRVETVLILRRDPSQLFYLRTIIPETKDQDIPFPLPFLYMQKVYSRALDISSILRNHQRDENPNAFYITDQEALLFLDSEVPLLKQVGFFIQVPAWWSQKLTEQKLTIHGKVTDSFSKSKGMSLQDILSFHATAFLNGEELTANEMEQLDSLQSPYIKLRAQWIKVNTQQIHTAIAMYRQKKERPITAQEVLTFSIGKKLDWYGIPIETISTEGWVKKVIHQLLGKRKMHLLQQPKGFHGTLRHYQVNGFTWLTYLCKWGLGACLADDMGLGKTIQTLAFLEDTYSHSSKKPTLLICPTSVINNWRKEIQKFTPHLSVLVHHGMKRNKEDSFRNSSAKIAIVITSYQLLHRDFPFLRDMDWAGIIVDEAQNIKNPDSLQSKAVRSLKGGYRIALTGTPIENHVGDLWAIMDFLNPGLLGKQTTFDRLFFKPIQIAGSVEKMNQLRRITQPFILRRLKTDQTIIADLPDKIETKEYCLLTREQVSLYKALTERLKEQLMEVHGISRKGLILTAFTRLKQICNHPAHFTKEKGTYENRSGKLIRLCELIEEIVNAEERVLIFTQYAQMGFILQEYLTERFASPVYYLHGGVPKGKRDEMIDSFQNDAEAPHLFILSLKAGGTGITLTRANHVIHFDRWWNPAVENQATDRVFRIGQERNVQVHKLIVSGTLEERIDELIDRKTGVSGQIMDHADRWLTELSDQEIQSLVQLSEEITVE